MSDLVKRMKIMQWYKTLPFADRITLTWTSQRKRHTYATAFYRRNVITLYDLIFECTFESVQSCLLHEIAHFIDRDRRGCSYHDQVFQTILVELIGQYGTADIAAAKTGGTIATSTYKR